MLRSSGPPSACPSCCTQSPHFFNFCCLEFVKRIFTALSDNAFSKKIWGSVPTVDSQREMSSLRAEQGWALLILRTRVLKLATIRGLLRTADVVPSVLCLDSFWPVNYHTIIAIVSKFISIWNAVESLLWLCCGTRDQRKS